MEIPIASWESSIGLSETKEDNNSVLLQFSSSQETLHEYGPKDILNACSESKQKPY